MPTYHFLTKDRREELIRELKDAAGADQRYSAYLEALQDLNETMDELSAVETDPKKPDAGLPHDLTLEEAKSLQKKLKEVALQGETLLAQAEVQNELNQAVPRVLSSVQDMLARDYDVLGAYEGRPPLSLPEIQEAGRTLTIDLRGRKLGTIGNATSSRIPMTVVDSSGKKRTGFFTKASHAKIKGLYNEAIEAVKKACEKQAEREELDKLLGKIRRAMLRKSKPDGSRITTQDTDELILAAFFQNLHNLTCQKHGVETNTEVDLDSYSMADLLNKCGLDLGVFEDDYVIDVLTEQFNKLANSPGMHIMGMRMAVEDGARLDNRNSAMSAVASLLGVPGLIARSDPMKFIRDDGQVVDGTFMDFADGYDLHGNPKLMVGVHEDPFGSKEARQSLNRQIADLQVLDFICLNEDRHPGNLVYRLDKNGRINGIQGIDNDSSFVRRHTRPGEEMSLRVVSNTMAKTLEAVTPELLRFALRGHNLTPLEIDMAVERLALVKNRIKDKSLTTMSDEELGRKRPKQLGSKSVRPNVFDRVGSYLPERISEVHAAWGSGYKLPPLYKREYTKVQTNDRVYTVGGLKDALMAVSRLYRNTETGFKQSDLTGIRGKSTNFKNLMNAVKETTKLQKKLFEDKNRTTPDDSVSLDDGAAWSLRLKEVRESFDKLEEMANTYLEGKRVERGAERVEDIVANGPYEQKHIDYAKKVLESVQDFRLKTAEPETEAQKKAHQALLDKATLEEVRTARAKAQAIYQQNQEQAQNPILQA